MNVSLRLIGLVWLLLTGVSLATPDTTAIPEPLREWTQWAIWDQLDTLNAPRSYDNAARRFVVWPSALMLEVEETQGRFAYTAQLYGPGRVALPGGPEAWPVNVRAGEREVAVVPEKEVPVIALPPGRHRITGEFRWSKAPARLRLPPTIGLVELTLDGRPVEMPSRDQNGTLWLRQEATQEAEERDFLEAKIYAVLTDGVPLQWESVVELTVSGRNREERLGAALPEGWRLASLESPIPAMMDEQGELKAQVRSGRWVIRFKAFHLTPADKIRFAEGKPPVGETVLLGFRAAPELRIVELSGATQVDASLTTMPEEWRSLPVYRWETGAPLTLAERMRGSGEEQSAGLSVRRGLWLDEERGGLIFSDSITSPRQALWRLNVAPGQTLESVSADGKGQLVTRDPASGATGVEIRNRELNLTATGTIASRSAIPATGWEAGADQLGATLHLPPGWRLLACFGVDRVKGDWLTAWTLLDLFLLLVFTVAVFRLWGIPAAIVAFLAFGLAYHEPGAPVYSWLFLLVPLALLKVVPEGRGRTVVQVFKGVALLILLVGLIPFVIQQVQQAIYPQLEPRVEKVVYDTRTKVFSGESAASVPAPEYDAESKGGKAKVRAAAKMASLYDQEATARVQVGRGVPQWDWRTVELTWSGPVTASQVIRPILIPRPLVQVLTVVRVALLLLLASMLLEGGKVMGRVWKARGAALIMALAAMLPGTPSASAQGGYPGPEILETLRERLLKAPEAFPQAADIPAVRLDVQGRQLAMEAQVHTAEACAVPLPGRFPAWSPLRVTVSNEVEPVVMRHGGYLWISLPKGVHTVRVEGMIASQAEWEWTWQLAPRRVEVTAPEWNVTGWSEEPGRPGAQLFFARKEQERSVAASGYDRQEVASWVSVERTLELGLTWRVTTRVIRRTPTGRALNLRIPLLEGERVVSQGAMVDQGMMEVRLGAQDQEASWSGDLLPTESLTLTAPAEVPWLERWRVEVSPVWSLTIDGLPPIYETGAHLVPIWQPWPGESTTLKIVRPEAVEGATVAVKSVAQELKAGQRQRTGSLVLALQSSLGEEFAVALPEGAEVTALTLKGQPVPVRRDQGRVLVTLTPGEQTLKLDWQRSEPLGLVTRGEEVKLPYESSNITTEIQVPSDRWIVAVDGPLRGPALRFWGLVICAVLGGWVLGRVPASPLKGYQWALLLIGVTQGSTVLMLLVASWFFLFVWRGHGSFAKLPPVAHNFLQVVFVGSTVVFVGCLIFVVWRGLLGQPEMFITGSEGYAGQLRWFSPQSGHLLPRPAVTTLSIWWYRLLMLLWALWLANGLVRWLGWAWAQFSQGGVFRSVYRNPAEPPELPKS